jgi:hypothetical protein
MIVVCVPGGRRGVWDLPESTLVERSVIAGGERTLYEIAFAAAAIGRTSSEGGSPGRFSRIFVMRPPIMFHRGCNSLRDVRRPMIA